MLELLGIDKIPDVWSKYVSGPLDDFEGNYQAQLWPEGTTHIPGGMASGMTSNLRHASAASALKNRISKMLALGGNTNKLTNTLGGIASFLGMGAHEVPTTKEQWSNIYEGIKEGPNMNWLQNQTTEDILANWFGIWHGGKSPDPTAEYETLEPKLAFNSGLLSNALLNIAEGRGYTTKHDLRKSIARGDPSFHGIHIPHKDLTQSSDFTRHRSFLHPDITKTGGTTNWMRNNLLNRGFLTEPRRGLGRTRRGGATITEIGDTLLPDTRGITNTSAARKRKNVYEGL